MNPSPGWILFRSSGQSSEIAELVGIFTSRREAVVFASRARLKIEEYSLGSFRPNMGFQLELDEVWERAKAKKEEK